MPIPVLIVGTGNPLLSDDGVGLRAVDALRRRYEIPASVQMLDGGTAGLGLVAELSQADRILILDAVRTRKLPSGAVVTLDADALIAAPRGLFPHEVGVADVVATLRLMGRAPEIVLLGVEAETVRPGLELSPSVAASFERLLDAAVRQLKRWGIEIAPSPTDESSDLETNKNPDHQITEFPFFSHA